MTSIGCRLILLWMVINYITINKVKCFNISKTDNFNETDDNSTWFTNSFQLEFDNDKKLNSTREAKEYVPLNSVTLSSLYKSSHHHDNSKPSWWDNLQTKQKKTNHQYKKEEHLRKLNSVIEKFLYFYEAKNQPVDLDKLKNVLITILYSLTLNEYQFSDKQLLNVFFKKLYQPDRGNSHILIPEKRKIFLHKAIEKILKTKSNHHLYSNTRLSASLSGYPQLSHVHQQNNNDDNDHRVENIILDRISQTDSFEIESPHSIEYTTQPNFKIFNIQKQVVNFNDNTLDRRSNGKKPLFQEVTENPLEKPQFGIVNHPPNYKVIFNNNKLIDGVSFKDLLKKTGSYEEKDSENTLIKPGMWSIPVDSPNNDESNLHIGLNSDKNQAKPDLSKSKTLSPFLFKNFLKKHYSQNTFNKKKPNREISLAYLKASPFIHKEKPIKKKKPAHKTFNSHILDKLIENRFKPPPDEYSSKLKYHLDKLRQKNNPLDWINSKNSSDYNHFLKHTFSLNKEFHQLQHRHEDIFKDDDRYQENFIQDLRNTLKKHQDLLEKRKQKRHQFNNPWKPPDNYRKKVYHQDNYRPFSEVFDKPSKYKDRASWDIPKYKDPISLEHPKYKDRASVNIPKPTFPAALFHKFTSQEYNNDDNRHKEVPKYDRYSHDIPEDDFLDDEWKRVVGNRAKPIPNDDRNQEIPISPGSLKVPKVVAKIFKDRLDLFAPKLSHGIRSTGPIDVPSALRLHGQLDQFVKKDKPVFDIPSRTQNNRYPSINNKRLNIRDSRPAVDIPGPNEFSSRPNQRPQSQTNGIINTNLTPMLTPQISVDELPSKPNFLNDAIQRPMFGNSRPQSDEMPTMQIDEIPSSNPNFLNDVIQRPNFGNSQPTQNEMPPTMQVDEIPSSNPNFLNDVIQRPNFGGNLRPSDELSTMQVDEIPNMNSVDEFPMPEFNNDITNNNVLPQITSINIPEAPEEIQVIDAMRNNELPNRLDTTSEVSGRNGNINSYRVESIPNFRSSSQDLNQIKELQRKNKFLMKLFKEAITSSVNSRTNNVSQRKTFTNYGSLPNYNNNNYPNYLNQASGYLPRNSYAIPNMNNNNNVANWFNTPAQIQPLKENFKILPAQPLPQPKLSQQTYVNQLYKSNNNKYMYG